MGKYQQVLTAVHEFDWAILALFGVGAVIGLLGFSRLLKHLLSRFRAGTMAFLVGLMLGFPAQGVAVPQRAGGGALRMRVAAGIQRRGLVELGIDCRGRCVGLGVGAAGTEAVKRLRIVVKW